MNEQSKTNETPIDGYLAVMPSCLNLPLIEKWFKMTIQQIKPEDYREITPYWCNRLLLNNGGRRSKDFWERCYLKMYTRETFKEWFENEIIHRITPKHFDFNVMTLGYPKSTDLDRIVKLEHKGIEVRTGNPEWGAIPNQLYFVIVHGDVIA